MQYRVEFTRRAARDLDELYAGKNAENSAAAARWFNGLEKSILQLESSPRLGMVTRGHRSVRQLIYGKKPHFYRVLYEINLTLRIVRILHIRHGRRDRSEE